MEVKEVLERNVPVKELIKEFGSEHTFNLAREAARNYVYKLRNQGRISFSEPEEAEVTSIHLVRRTLPEAWEDTTMALVGVGSLVHTGYDPTTKGADYKGEYISFPSMEGTAVMHIQEPAGEPRFHKNFLGGWLGLGSYLAEIEGVHDHWMISPEVVAEMLKKKRFDEIKNDKRWNYTYHQRLTAYPYIDVEAQPRTINQIESVINKLINEPLTKSAQAITWDPRWDHNDGQMGVKWEDYHSPCLQRFWFRLFPFGGGYKLNVNGHWRSRDHLKAVPQNIFAVSEGIFELVRRELQYKLGVPVVQGRYVDINDSLHVYGHFLDARMQGGDAEKYVADIFKVARGEPLENRLVIPGTLLHDVYIEEVKKEYEATKANHDLVRHS